ncbi:MAG: glycerate kinase [Bacteroidales bacterium]
MKIVIAPDSFKGSLSALEVGNAIRDGIVKVGHDIDTIVVPMADGGEGIVQSLIDATGGDIIKTTVHDPLFRTIDSFYGILGDGKTAVIEMAAASGLPLLKPEERDPLKTTSYGTGELIKDAMDKGCTSIILGLGGSATNDGGIGMAQALGVCFLDENGNSVHVGGHELSRIRTIDVSGIDDRVSNVKFIAACDVDNPLCGQNGASNVYGRQKGASDSDVETLDKGLVHFAHIVKNSLGLDIKDLPGTGAAGGLGYAVMLFLNARLERGIDIVTRLLKLDEIICGADLVITGEGKMDAQTAFGKTPYGVAQIARKMNIPVVALAGSLGPGYSTLYNSGFDCIYSIIDRPMLLEEALANTKELLENSAENVVRLWNAVKIK